LHTMAHYALVSRSKPLQVPVQVPVVETRNENTSPVDNNTSNIRDELTQVFQEYADNYPNTHLAEEARLRDTLLQAASAAANAKSQNQNKRPKTQSGGGFFSRLLFGGNKDPDDDGTKPSTNKDTTLEDPLVYMEPERQDEYDNVDNDSLCGTMASLETACIPAEAYSVARFHLTSSQTRRQQPNAVRVAPSRSPQTNTHSTKMLVIVGLGLIAVLEPDQDMDDDDDIEDGELSNSRILPTSDQQDLLDFAQQQQQDGASSPWDLSHARAVAIGPTCIAVSWGFVDGLICFYKRIVTPELNGWEQVWIMGPSQPVLESMMNDNMLHEDSDHVGSPLLIVADMIPLLVESPSVSSTTEQQSQSEASLSSSIETPMVASMAVARIGGFMELVPLPTNLWYGPVITKHDKRKRQGSKRKRHGQHYAVGKQIGSQELTLALTTGEYHFDITCLEAFRTQVTGDTEWDMEAFPDTPPAEFVLAASGTSKQHGMECMTFWAVSTLFTDDDDNGGGQRSKKSNADDEHAMGFRLHAALIEALTATSGAGVSIFATRGILERWRTPRHIELRQHASLGETPQISGGGGGDNDREHPEAPKEPTTRVTTISTPAPLVSMRFCQSDGSHASQNTGPFLAVLDWNGCVTILDCFFMERVAAQSLSQQEYELYRSSNHHLPFPLATTVVTRSHFVESLLQTNSNNSAKVIGLPKAPTPVVNLHWLGSAGPVTGILPPLVLLMQKPRKLQIITFFLPEEETEDGARGPRSSLISLPFPGHGATMETLGEGNLSFVSLRRGKKQNQPSLTCFMMQRLQPQAIIQSLASASKFEEAIRAASKLSEADQNVLAEVVQDCHKRIWESKRDVDSLAETRDMNYVVQQAVSFCRMDAPARDVTLEKLRLVCSLALIMGKNSKSEQQSMDEIRHFLVKLGTYELLCRHFGVQPSFERFWEQVTDMPTKGLALQFARTAEIMALSIIFFRHRQDLVGETLQILGQIPFTLDPAVYCHLLPIVRDRKLADTFLSHTGIEPLSHMPQYLKDLEGVVTVLDTKDEKMVLDRNQNLSSFDESDLASSTATWFVARAGKMQTFIGNVQPVILLCEIGLKCSHHSMAQSSMLSAPAAVQQLYKTWKSATSLQEMLAEGVVAVDSDGSTASYSTYINTEELLQMELVDIVAMVLGGETETDEIFERCTKYLQPLLVDITLASATDSKNDLDRAVASYCIGLARGCADIDVREKEQEAELLDYALKALASCAAIAAASRTSIEMQNRLVKDKQVLIAMVVSAIDETSLACERIHIPVAESRYLIDSMWEMYEALPAHIPSQAASAESLVPLLEKLDVLYKDLVGVDILSRWPECRPLAFFVQQQRSRKDIAAQSDEAIIEDGLKVVAKLCRSFVVQVASGHSTSGHSVLSPETMDSLLHDLQSDVEQLNTICYDELLPIESAVCLHLIAPLLQQENFRLVSQLLSNGKTKFVQKDQVKGVILSYVNEAVFSESTDGMKVAAAIKCQDAIGPVFPDLTAGFMAVRQYLEAANFISSVIYEGRGNKPMKPSDLRKTPPLDVIESTLADMPVSVVCGCTRWMDDDFARKANQTFRSVNSRNRNPGEGPAHEANMPPLPGGAIFHLATILGLSDDMSALVVKSRVVHYAIAEGLYGAAAAICRTLVCEEKSQSLGAEAVALVKLSAVAEVVCEEQYSDLTTRRELGTAVLQKFTGSLSVNNCEPFDAIVAALPILEQRTSPFCREQQGQASTVRMRPIARLYKHVRLEYNGDVHALFTDLLLQTSRGQVHDSLMNALSRFVVYFCVSDSVRLKDAVNKIEIADAEEVLALGSSLILHIPSNETALACVEELRTIIDNQVANVSNEERFSTQLDLCVPDPDTVRQLIGRGFSENGARRAAVMTQNSGFKAALGWGVAHSMDDDFNTPIIYVKIPGQSFIDESAIRSLQKCLFATDGFLKEPTSKAPFFRSLATMHKISSCTTPSTAPTSAPTSATEIKSTIQKSKSAIPSTNNFVSPRHTEEPKPAFAKQSMASSQKNEESRPATTTVVRSIAPSHSKELKPTKSKTTRSMAPLPVKESTSTITTTAESTKQWRSPFEESKPSKTKTTRSMAPSPVKESTPTITTTTQSTKQSTAQWRSPFEESKPTKTTTARSIAPLPVKESKPTIATTTQSTAQWRSPFEESTPTKSTTARSIAPSPSKELKPTKSTTTRSITRLTAPSPVKESKPEVSSAAHLLVPQEAHELKPVPSTAVRSIDPPQANNNCSVPPPIPPEFPFKTNDLLNRRNTISATPQSPDLTGTHQVANSVTQPTKRDNGTLPPRPPLPSATANNVPNGSGSIFAPTDTTTKSIPKAPSPRKPAAPAPKAPAATATPNGQPLRVSTRSMRGLRLDTAATPSPRSSPLSSNDRAELRKRGEEAKATLSGLRSPGSAADRKRLMEEGRELLRRARSANGTPPPPPPPPLRPAPASATKAASTGTTPKTPPSSQNVERHIHNPSKPASNSFNTDVRKQAVPAAKSGRSKVVQKLADKADDNDSAAGWDFEDDF
jgi:hypothetical protein